MEELKHNENLDSSPATHDLSYEDIQEIKEELVKSPETASSQLGKFNVAIGQGSEIHIGDIVNQALDEASLKALILAIQEANESTNGRVYQYLQNVPLETLNFDIAQIKEINSDLRFVSRLNSKRFLTETQKIAFSNLKEEVHALNEFNRRLEGLYCATKSLLKETRSSLIQKIQVLKQQGEELLDPQALEHISKEQECKAKELKILEDFIWELEESEKMAKWIDATRKNVAKRFGREALKDFPDIEENTAPEKISDFCLSIYQFLEQIVYCLTWGTRDILDSPDIPLVFDYPVYEKAFVLIKIFINKNLPSRFTPKSRELTCECIDYLILQLPFYEKE